MIESEKVKRWRGLANGFYDSRPPDTQLSFDGLPAAILVRALREAADEVERLVALQAKADEYTISLLDKYEPNRVIRAPDGKYVHRVTGEPG